MSAHVKVYVAKYSIPTGLWFYICDACRGLTTRPTHAEALAAAWAHIKEHS